MVRRLAEKLFDTFLDAVLLPVLAPIGTLVATAVGSKLSTGDWLTWLRAVPMKVWLILFAVGGIWFVAVLIGRRVRELRAARSHSGPAVFSVPMHGWIELAEFTHTGVLWRVRAPRESTWELEDKTSVDPSDIDVATPPRCPRCKTELEESQRFLGGYVWKCVRCGFKRSNKESFYREADRAEKIARREWEMRRE
jgi:ribosomal protein L37AE/L43A/uncharacterized integral membrane protein